MSAFKIRQQEMTDYALAKNKKIPLSRRWTGHMLLRFRNRMAYARSLWILIRIVYTELQYWLIGLLPESYHWSQGSAWKEYGNHRRAATHFKRFLTNSDNTHVRLQLAYCYASLGAWDAAAHEYRLLLAVWPHPSIMLALAEACLHLGNFADARSLVAAVELDHTPPQNNLPAVLEEIKRQLQVATDKTVAPPR